MKIEICDNDETELTPDSKLSLIDGAGSRVLSNYSLFLNGTPCENISNFGLDNFVISYLQISKDIFKTVGRNMYHKDISTKNHDVFTADYFVNQTWDETDIQTECKDSIHMMTPLGMEMS